MKYVGDISKQDAELLSDYARRSRTILEFGVGGSTQVIAQSIDRQTSFISLDTQENWIATTRENLRRLGVEDRCRMALYSNWPTDKVLFDLIFNDGMDSLRREFALRSFPMLVAGGTMLFHDTRRLSDVQNVLAVVEKFFDEIEHVHLNERVGGVSSNITAIRKKSKEPYVNWNAVERRLAWQQGHAAVPESFWLKK